MRSRAVSGLLAGVLSALALVVAAPEAGAALGPDDLELVESRRVEPRLLELTFRTPAVEGETGVRVLLPEGYEGDSGGRYPVLYLLHGCCEGNTGYRTWTENGVLQRIAVGRPLIVVMPDSGSGGGYIDWYNDGAGGPPMWETYHIRQLLPWIDGHFKTVPGRTGRAVAGFSMGGFGAMHYAARHPGRFVAAASFSGAVDTNSLFLQASNGFGVLDPVIHSGKSPVGPRATQEVRDRGHNPWDLAENLDGLDLVLRSANGMPGGPGDDPRSATGDPVEWEVHKESVSLHRRLTELGISHVWEDHGPGCHGCFLDSDLEQLMSDLGRVFADPPAPPSPLTHRSIEASYEAYGWQVEIDRPALEWSELRDASRSGFALRGSGTGTVTTPPLYSPNHTLDVEVVSGGGVESTPVRTDDDCRLTLEVPLGPGNPHQQYTAQARAHGVQHSLEAPGSAPSSDTSGTVVYTTRVRIDARQALGCPGRVG